MLTFDKNNYNVFTNSKKLTEVSNAKPINQRLEENL